MRYIKKFNESNEKYLNLKDLVETHLVDLIDNGVTVECEHAGGRTWISVDIKILFGEDIYWNDIKDSIIPLVQMLEVDFIIKQINIYNWSGDYAVDCGYDCDNSMDLDKISDDKLLSNEIERMEIFIIEDKI